MLGAIAGDVIGSAHESARTKTKDFPLLTPRSRFTDDTVLTVAVADCLLHGRDYVETFHDYFHAYPDAGYGGTFCLWALSRRRTPYQSWGNGSAMRVSPVAWAFDNLDEVLHRAKESARVTHNHPEGVKGAQATAAAIFLARRGVAKWELREELERRFHYDLSFTLDDVRPTYTFDSSCQGTVPHAVVAFLESVDYETAVRLAISLGGDCDTLACIAGGIAAAYYGVPLHIREQALVHLDEPLSEIVAEFEDRFPEAAKPAETSD